MKNEKITVKDIKNSYEQLSQCILQQKGRRMLAISAISGAMIMGANQIELQAQIHFQAPIAYPDGISLSSDIEFLRPEYHDIDGDGDFDLIGTAVDPYDTTYMFDILYFPNIGSNNQPEFGEAVIMPTDTGTQEFYTFGDLDNDGDIDALGILVSYDTQTYGLARDLVYYENQSQDSLDFADPVINPFGLEEYTSSNHLVLTNLIDFDSDGDLDIVTTETYIGFFYPSDFEVVFIENSGTPGNPIFENPSLILDNPDYLGDNIFIPAIGDVDRDGDFDILGISYDLSTSETNFLYLENTFEGGMPTYPRAVKDTFNLETIDDEVAYPVLLDYDNDGDLDLVTGREYEPRINLYLNSDLSSTRHISLDDIGVKLYPNPASEFIHLTLPKEISGEIQIINIEGKSIYRQAISNTQMQISIGHFPSGTYFLKLNGDHVEGYEKFIKE